MSHTIRVASMANAQVKSSQEMGSFELRLKNSMMSMRRVMQKQKHQVNMHHVQKDSVECPTEATKLKEMQVKITSSIRTMPTGVASVLKSSVTMTLLTVVSLLWSCVSN